MNLVCGACMHGLPAHMHGCYDPQLDSSGRWPYKVLSHCCYNWLAMAPLCPSEPTRGRGRRAWTHGHTRLGTRLDH